MNWKAFRIGMLALAMAAGPMATSAPAQDKTLFMPLLVYRTGPYAPSGIPLANAGTDYFNLINERDGGINGVKLTFEECETQYDTKQGVECYERLKGKGPLIINPYSTGIAYQLIPKAAVDKVVVHSMGYGMTASAAMQYVAMGTTVPAMEATDLKRQLARARADNGADTLPGCAKPWWRTQRSGACRR
jgi:branched-chain amino acid transport system substrate-binding protein